MATVVITGGTGMIGSALTHTLVKKGYEVIILSRAERSSTEKNISYAVWDPEAQTIAREAIEKADYLIHLAGANVGDKRWTAKRKKEIVDSRVKSGKLLVKSLKEIPNKIRAVISSSAIGYYGPDPAPTSPSHEERRSRAFIETDPPYNDFLATTVQQWEQAIQPVSELGKRLVVFRTGIVLSKEGGAYPEFKKPLRFGMATVLGSGEQIVSWIHIDDLVRLYMAALEDDRWQGVYNAVSPQPVSNKTLITQMAKQANGFYIRTKVPAFVLKTVLGEMSIEVLKSTTVSSEKIQEKGFQFRFPTIKQALAALSQ